MRKGEIKRASASEIDEQKAELHQHKPCEPTLRLSARYQGRQRRGGVKQIHANLTQMRTGSNHLETKASGGQGSDGGSTEGEEHRATARHTERERVSE